MLRNRSTLKPYLPLLSVLLLASPAQAEKKYHLWYDENGQAVYSQFEPGDGRDSSTVKPPPPPAESPEVARARLDRQLQQFEDNREDRALAQGEAAKVAASRQQADQRCEEARRNLTLVDGKARQLFRDSEGNVRRMSEKERADQRAQLEAVIKSECH